MNSLSYKKILLSISGGAQARNLLQNDFYKLLKESGCKIIIVTSAHDDARFIKEFGGQNVTMLPLLDAHEPFLDYVFGRGNSFLIYNRNTVRLSLYDYVEPPKNVLKKRLKYVTLRAIFKPLSWIKSLRRLSQFLDYKFAQKDAVKKYQDILRTHKPDLVFSTSVVHESEVALLKAARIEKIRTIGMPKSWDNPSKLYFRAKVDKMVVWSDFMVGQLKKIHLYKEEDIAMIGVPQFDLYTDKSRLLSREEFCMQFNFDPTKKIIFFGSEGKLVPSDVDIVPILYNFIKEEKLDEPAQLLIRPHYGYKNDEQKFADFLDGRVPGVAVDQTWEPSSFRDQWDYSVRQMNHFFNTMYHSDVIVNTCSTLTLDSAAVGRPVVLIKFDGLEEKKFYQSVRRWYGCDYYARILKFGAVSEVYSAQDMLDAINISLKNKDHLLKERQEMLEDLCYKVDGGSGRRLFEVVVELTG